VILKTIDYYVQLVSYSNICWEFFSLCRIINYSYTFSSLSTTN